MPDVPIRRCIALAYGYRIPSVRSIYLDLPLRVMAIASSHDRDVRLVRLEEDTDHSWAVLGNGDHGIDGVILDEHVLGDPERLMRHLRIPAVVVNWCGDLPVDQVGTDDRRGMELAVEHLHRQGHRRLLYVWNGNGTHPPSINGRRASYRAATARLGIMGDEHIGQLESVIVGLRSGKHPRAIITYSSIEARALHGLLMDAGLLPGRDCALLSCNDHPWMEDAAPAISAMDIGMEEMTRQAVALLLSRIDQQGALLPPRTAVVQPRLIERATTPALGNADRDPSR